MLRAYRPQPHGTTSELMKHRLKLGMAIMLALSACATLPPRIPHTLFDQDAATVLGDEPIRFWSRGDDARYSAWSARMLNDRQAASLGRPRTILALSGGSDKGAFSAGLLNAWTARGDRPQFDLVSGVSTGALIAPFAFLGTSEDAKLERLYTTLGRNDIYHRSVLSGLFGGASLLDTKPLQELIAHDVTPAVLDRIAVEHRRGRRLLVMTTNLDAQRGVIWDMGAIAASASPRRLALFRQVLLASAAIPGAFPPVLIDVTGNGREFSELHIDGGTVGGFFVLPRAMLFDPQVKPAGDEAIYVLYNGRLAPDFEVTKPRTFGILSRALLTLLGETDRASVEDLRLFTRENGVALIVCAIDQPTGVDDAPLFDTKRMQTLYSLGKQTVGSPDGCLSTSQRK